MIVRVLSLQQPWASFVAWGIKIWETRGMNTEYRGTFCIQSSKYDPKDKYGGKKESETNEFFIKALAERKLTFEQLPFGAIIGQADITSVHPTQYLKTLWTNDKQAFPVERELAFGDYRPGRKGWKLKNPIEYKPVIADVKGKVYPFWEYDLPHPYGMRTRFIHDTNSEDHDLGTIAGYNDKLKFPYTIQTQAGGRGVWKADAFMFL